MNHTSKVSDSVDMVSIDLVIKSLTPFLDSFHVPPLLLALVSLICTSWSESPSVSSFGTGRKFNQTPIAPLTTIRPHANLLSQAIFEPLEPYPDLRKTHYMSTDLSKCSWRCMWHHQSWYASKVLGGGSIPYQ